MNSNTLSKFIINNPDRIDDVLLFISKYKLSYLLPEIYTKVNLINSKTRLNEEIILETAREVDRELINKIENNYDIKIDKSTINPNILAGFKIYTKEKIVDYSLENIIKQLLK